MPDILFLCTGRCHTQGKEGEFPFNDFFHEFLLELYAILLLFILLGLSRLEALFHLADVIV